MPAHPADQMRPALEREQSAHHKGGQQVRGLEALRLRHHLELGDGGSGGGRQLPRLESPVGAGLNRRASCKSRQVDEVQRRVDILDVEIRFLPQLDRLCQADSREAVPSARTSHRDEGSALGRLPLGGSAELGVEELPQARGWGERRGNLRRV